MQIAAWRARREKLDPELVYDMAIYVFIGGLVGARGFYVFQYWGERVHERLGNLRDLEGRDRPLRQHPRRDARLPLLSMASPVPAPADARRPRPGGCCSGSPYIGRVGCFLNGCCFGDACNLPWAVRFPKDSPPWVSEVTRNLIRPDAEHSLWLHPTQLYSAVDGLVLFLLLSAFYPLRKRDGQVIGLLLLTYPVTRFLIEHLRNDEGIFAAGMTISQFISVGIFAFGVAFWVILSRRPAWRLADGFEAKSTTPEPVASLS